MNDQSLGAILILTGLAMLWALWSKNSPFRSVPSPFAGPPNQKSSGGGGPPGGGSGFE
jgi:hypothetical protein